MGRVQANQSYAELFTAAAEDGPAQVKLVTASLGRQDLFFLLTRILNRADIDNDFLYARCREVQASPDGHLDLWAREHYKSTIITFGLTIQDILNDPEITVGIFSHTRPIAKSFLRQIKREFEDNALLKELYPDVLLDNPRKESPSWSEDGGIIVRRKTNPKEATVEAHGLVDGQPTSRHFSRLIYDDVVTRESVTTPEMIQKTTDALALSYNLGAHGGKRRFIGTRYHFNDTYREIIARGTAVPRIYPATQDGTVGGEPVFLDRETLAAKRRDMGPFVFSCHASGTLITMSDWSQKKIEEVQVGDEVVGWAKVSGGKATLTPTRVVATRNRIAEAVQSTLANGTNLLHTPDHQWWTGRMGTDGHREYAPLGFAYGNEQKGLCQAVDLSHLTEELSPEQLAAAGYLAGIIDGEGGVNYRVVQITQDCYLHPHVCAKIEWSLETLGFQYAKFDRKREERVGIQRMYTVHGGRQARVRMLHILGAYLGKKDQIVSQCYGSRNFGKKSRVELVAQQAVGEIEVYNIQTETGNYLANGYCSKNCQMLQNPVADEAQGFQESWIRRWQGDNSNGLNFYITCDPASSKKKGSDYTVFWVIGIGGDQNYYVVDVVRDRLSLKQRTDALFQLHQHYRPLGVGYEKYGMQSDIEHIELEMERLNYRFDITPLGGQLAKEERIKRLVPVFEQGRMFLPVAVSKRNYEGKVEELIQLFIDDEYKVFPVSVHDDMLDGLARILEPEMNVQFPMFGPDEYDYGMNFRQKRNEDTGY